MHLSDERSKDTNRKIRTTFFIDYLLEIWFQIPSIYILCVASIASDFTCVYNTAVGTVFETTDVYKLSFSYLYISIFRVKIQNPDVQSDNSMVGVGNFMC